MADTTAETTDETVDEAPDVPEPTGVAFTLNGTDLRADEGELLIDAAERNGVYIPRFCYHPRMKPVGMCRMCLVEVDTGRGPALQPACMLTVTPDMKVETESDVAKKAQGGVLEFLLINHPLDCPVCDKGGECPLQDQTMAYGPGESRFVEEKRHYEKPIPISDLVFLDRERCILCDRCTRFSADVAGDSLIHFLDRGNQTQVNTFPEHPFASYFSGNTVQICPVGALTASPYRFKARPWDLEEGESTCQTCSVGCRVAVHTSRDRIVRYLGVDVDPVNWGWMCDKGRFGFEAVNSEARLGQPLVRSGDAHQEVPWARALNEAAGLIRATLDTKGRGGIGIIGGSRLTNEDAYAWSKLAKAVIGTDNVDCQLGDGLPADLVLGAPRATIDEACSPGGTVLLVAPDLKEELPVLFLRLRHAAVEDDVTVIEISPRTTSFSELAALSLHPRPGQLGAVARAVAGDADGSEVGGVAPGDLARAAALAAVASGPVTVILGRQSLAETNGFAVDAAAALLDGLAGSRILPVLRRANVHGALDMGLAPGMLPGRVTLDDGREWFTEHWGTVPDDRGLDTVAMLEAAAAGEIETLILLGADVFDVPHRDLAVAALSNTKVIALDLFETDSTALADVVLPAAGFGECYGTTTNIEGRISPVNQRSNPPGTARSDWMIAVELASRLGSDLRLDSVAQIWDEIERVAVSHAGISTLVLRSPAVAAGVVAPLDDAESLLAELSTPVTITGLAVHGGSGLTAAERAATVLPVADEADESDEVEAADPADDADPAQDTDDDADGSASDDGADDVIDESEPDSPAAVLPPAMVRFEAPDRQEEPPAIDSYSLRLIASRRLYDQGTLNRHAPSLAGLADGTRIRINPYDFDRLGVADGDEVRVSSSTAELVAEVAADDGVPRGSAAMIFNQPNLAVAELIDATAPVTDVRVETTAAGVG